LAATAGVGGGASSSGGSGGGGFAQLRNLGAVGETCETLCETSYGETLRFKHEPCRDGLDFQGLAARSPGIRAVLKFYHKHAMFSGGRRI